MNGHSATMVYQLLLYRNGKWKRKRLSIHACRLNRPTYQGFLSGQSSPGPKGLSWEPGGRLRAVRHLRANQYKKWRFQHSQLCPVESQQQLGTKGEKSATKNGAASCFTVTTIYYSSTIGRKERADA